MRDLVISSAGEEQWQVIRKKAGLEEDDFVAMSPYDDAITYKLVAAASEALDTPAAEILEAFGRHWILFTGAEGWGPILDLQGSTVVEVLGNLDDMHTRLKATMPALTMPRFVVSQSDSNEITCEYHSSREGLAPMVTGLLRGLAERCNEGWNVEHVRSRAEDGYDTFVLTASTT